MLSIDLVPRQREQKNIKLFSGLVDQDNDDSHLCRQDKVAAILAL
jgi:hypothetical protein